MTRVRLGWAVGAVAALVGLCLPAGMAGAASPELHDISPVGAQRGTEVEFTFTGRRLGDTKEVLFYRPGMTTKKLTPAGANAVKVTLAVAADCPLGEHPLRLRTVSGITELRTLWIGALPVVAEKEPNNDFAAPQPIALNATVEGVVTNEDVDYYRIQATKGQRLVAEIEAMRLGRAMFDPYVAILDAKRFELSASDDSALLLQDSLASVIAPADGTYVVRVREASYGGSGACRYRLHVGTFPRPTAIYPAGGPAGQKVEATFLGDVAGPIKQLLTLPAARTDDFPLLARQNNQSAPSPNAFRVSALANVLEAEPNGDAAHATKAPAALPVALNGIIAKEGDHDWFRVTARKGQTFDVELFARRLRSPLDAVMDLFDGTGKHLAGNDDSRGPDSYLRFTAPANGEYLLRVRDHLGRGGSDFVYRVEFLAPAPALAVQVPQFDRNNPQTRQTVAVPRGNRSAALLRVRRTNIGGEMTLVFPDLPAGLTAQADTMAANVDVLPVVFEAPPTAALAGKLASVLARPAKGEIKLTGRLDHDIPLVRGAPNLTLYYQTRVDRLAVAVTEAVGYKIHIVEPKVPIVQNGSMQLRVAVERAKGFDAPVQLLMLWNPPGISSASSVQVPKGATEAVYPLNANAGAPPRAWKIAVVGYATVKDGPVWTSTQLATLRVSAPYVAGSLAMAAVEQGQQAAVVLTVDQKHAFPGTARLRLLGLPAKAAAPEAQIDAKVKQHTFVVATAGDTPPGTHRSLFCELVVTENGEPIVHRFGQGGVLRVDRPRLAAKPPAAKKPPAGKPLAVKKPPPPKPLSRLEQLRLEREKRLKEGSK